MTSSTAAPATRRAAEPSSEDLERTNRWWRAADYPSVGQISPLDNPLLREPRRRDHVKPRLLRHWGTTPGLTSLYAHLSRAITAREQSTVSITGPGHNGTGLVASAYLEGTCSEVSSDILLASGGRYTRTTSAFFRWRRPAREGPRPGTRSTCCRLRCRRAHPGSCVDAGARRRHPGGPRPGVARRRADSDRRGRPGAAGHAGHRRGQRVSP